MNENLNVRIVKEEDYVDLQKYIYVRDTLEQIKERVKENIKIAQEKEGMQLVCEIDGHAIATVVIKKNSHPFRKHIAELFDVVTNYQFQGKGIAKKLIEESKKYAKESGIKILLVSVRGGTPAETVYRKLGFMEYGQLKNGIIESWADGQTFDEIFFYMDMKE